MSRFREKEILLWTPLSSIRYACMLWQAWPSSMNSESEWVEIYFQKLYIPLSGPMKGR